jgi:flagellar biosynthesis/type III secretory pathway protein FliH
MGSDDKHPRPERCRDRGCDRYGCLLYRTGREDGYRDGHDDGERQGYADGERDGYRQGHRDGHREGERQGYREGLAACARTHK